MGDQCSENLGEEREVLNRSYEAGVLVHNSQLAIE